MTDQEAIYLYRIRQAREHSPLVDFFVFGSRARGDAGEDSDQDFFLEVESRERISGVTGEIGFNNYLVIS